MLKTFLLNIAKYAPFCLRWVVSQPSSIVFCLTHRCNCRCVMCGYWRSGSSEELSTQEIEDILKQARDLGVRYCLFYGGEPLLREDLPALIAAASRLGMRPEVITNGLLLDGAKAVVLVESGMRGVVVSIDAVGSLQDEIRGIPGACERSLEGLKNIIRAAEGKDLKVMIGALLMRPTLLDQSIFLLLDQARLLGVPLVIQLLDISGPSFQFDSLAAKDNLWIGDDLWDQLDVFVRKLIKIKKKEPSLIVNSLSSLRFIEKYFRDPHAVDLPCYRAYGGKIWVGSQGEVYACQSLPPVAHLREKSLKEAIFSKAWAEGAVKMFQKKCPGCSCDYGSNIDSDIFLSFRGMIEGRVKSFVGYRK